MTAGARSGLCDLRQHAMATCVCACCLGMATTAFAQSSGDGTVWFALGVATRSPAAIGIDFEPPVLFGLTGRGRATQAVDVPRSTMLAIEAGMNWFPMRFAGLELWAARDTASALAPSSPYVTSLTYQTRQPPDQVLREVRYDRQAAWPAVQTDITRWTVSLNGALRWTGSSRLSGTVTGGLSWVRVSGHAVPIGFTTFVLGGRAVLFPNEYRLDTELGPSSALRFNIGGTADTRLTSHLALLVAARFIGGADLELPLHVVDVDRSQAGFSPPDNEEIDRLLVRSAARVPPGSLRVLTGLKVLF